MQLTLERVSKTVAGEVHLHPLELALQPGQVTVLLGATQAGKTSLMRIMAGLDRPTQGRVLVDGEDVTTQPVQQRQVAMVYQQFINYPSMTVYDNIASPLKLRGQSGIDERVQQLANKLHIQPFLQRLPAELSGGQQQRVALARALAKQASLMLLDEPLVNLDYKLREELRDELTELFATGQSTVVYATTEPSEALLLGGYTAVLDQGELLQYGPTAEVFHQPRSLRVAAAFSDPPMNLIQATGAGQTALLAGGLSLPLGRELPNQQLVIGVRANAWRLQGGAGDVVVRGQLELAEISGSDTFLHVKANIGSLVAQLSGVHNLPLGAPISLHLAPSQVYVFDPQGPLLMAPARAGAR